MSHNPDSITSFSSSLEDTINSFETTEVKECVRKFSNVAFGETDQIVSDLKNSSAALGTFQFDRLMKILFESGSNYDSIEYRLPSEYMKTYPQYLQKHTEGMKINGSEYHGHRIIVADPQDLHRDSLEADSALFYDWHKKNRVNLHSITTLQMSTILSDFNIEPARCASGFGLWREKFAVIFGELKDDKIITQIIEKGNPEFKKIENILYTATNTSRVIDAHGAYDVTMGELVRMWSDYVNPEKRWNLTKKFLYHFLEKYRDSHWIMDAAAGMGVEYRYMLEDGYMMSANEFQDDMRSVGIDYFEKTGLDIIYDMHRHDWRKLNNMTFRNKFGGVMVIGNSLRMLTSVTGQRESISAFYEILRAGGTIIIDERNYNRLVPRANEITYCEANPYDTDAFVSLKKFSQKNVNRMYHTEDVSAIPYMIDTDTGTIMFRYYVDVGNTHSMNDTHEKKIQEMTFLHAEHMEDLLTTAGFVNIRKYADYDLNRDLTLHKINDDAAMFVYVAEKSCL